MKPKDSNLEINHDTGNIKNIKKDPTNTCNGRLRFSDGYCDRPSGFGTKHLGTGRCKYHGGNNIGKQRKWFSATEMLDNTLAKSDILSKLEGISDSDPLSITNIDNEINVLRSVFYRYVKTCHEQDRMPHPGDLKKYTDSLSKMLEIRVKLSTKDPNDIVTANAFRVYVNLVTDILKKHIQDQNLLASIADDLEKIGSPEDNDSTRS